MVNEQILSGRCHLTSGHIRKPKPQTMNLKLYNLYKPCTSLYFLSMNPKPQTLCVARIRDGIVVLDRWATKETVSAALKDRFRANSSEEGLRVQTSRSWPSRASKKGSKFIRSEEPVSMGDAAAQKASPPGRPSVSLKQLCISRNHGLPSMACQMSTVSPLCGPPW